MKSVRRSEGRGCVEGSSWIREQKGRKAARLRERNGKCEAGSVEGERVPTKERAGKE